MATSGQPLYMYHHGRSAHTTCSDVHLVNSMNKMSQIAHGSSPHVFERLTAACFRPACLTVPRQAYPVQEIAFFTASLTLTIDILRMTTRSIVVARHGIDITARSLALQITIQRAQLAATSPSSPSPSSTRSSQAAPGAGSNLPLGVHAPAPLPVFANGTAALRAAGFGTYGGMGSSSDATSAAPGASDGSASSSQGPDLRSSADYAGAAGSPMETLSMLKSASSAAAALQNVDSAQLANELLAATDQVQR